MRSEMTDKQVLWMKVAIAALLVLVAAVLRILPHPWNLTPVGAMALFCGSVFKNKWVKFAFPVAALLAGDVAIGFHKLIAVVYLSFLVNVCIGMWIGENRKALRIASRTLLGAIQFFLVTNLAVWTAFTTYPKSFAGLIACYAAGLPFFWNTLAGDAIYATLLFGGYALADRWLKQSDEVSALPG
ncbi:MAG TPA: DUF6580 family putative transport protein [Candidatus Dormibacteraeota bacterium]|jgi:hypothetical protein|nr:DUF6580 family putative transport protein [Candidatus Dormibacteraeota bacterium]